MDAAVLAAMLQYSDDETVDYQKIIEDYINKNFTEAEKDLHGVIIDISAVEISEEGEMTAKATVVVPTSFLRLANMDKFTYSISSSAMVGGSSIEVALVLDNTGSMRGRKIRSLKKAANDLVDIIIPEGNPENEHIKFSIVPFADYVNIGMENRDESGLDIPDDYTVTRWTGGRNKCWYEYPDSTLVCRNNPRKWGTCYNDGVPYRCKKWNGRTCTGSRGRRVRKCKWVEGTARSKRYKWFGCMGSREHDLNVKDEEYETGVPGIFDTWNWCRQIAPITRLTSDRASILAGIRKMRSQRNTYIPSGLAWGWRTLSEEEPFSDGADYEEESVRKVIVLMTDGENTKSVRKWSGDKVKNHEGEVWGHNGGNTNQANTYTQELCSNIKAKGIMVFTIGFEVPSGSGIEGIMRGCAGNGGQYFDASDSTELADAFKKIGQSLLNLRLSK